MIRIEIDVSETSAISRMVGKPNNSDEAMVGLVLFTIFEKILERKNLKAISDELGLNNDDYIATSNRMVWGWKPFSKEDLNSEKT